MPNFKKIFQFSALILFCCLSIFSTSSTAENPDNKNLKNITLQLAWLHQFQFAGYYAAVEKGYYKEAGFQVKIIEGRPDLNPVEEVTTGRADFGVGRSEILLHRLKGKPVVAIAAILQHSAIVSLAKRESKITSPHDMIGKRVMMLSGDNAAEYLAMFLEEGVPLNRINRISSSYNINDLIEGQTDVFNAYSTNEPYFLKTKNIPVNIIKPINYGIDFYGDTLFTSEKKVKQAPSETKKFRAASIQGWKYALENQDEIIEIILSIYKSKKTRPHLQYEATALKKLIMPELIELGHMNPGRWDQMAQTYVKLKMADPGYSLEGFVYDPNPAPDYTMMKWLFRMGFFLSLTAILYAVLLRFHNKRMQVEIDQRKKTEESLLESEKKSKLILNSLTDMVVEVDSNMKIIWANKSALDINPDAIGQYCFTAFPGNKEMCDGCCCARAFETQRLEQAVMYQPSSKTAGESYWENIGIPLKNSDGEMTVLEVSRNVTSRVQAENQKNELIHDLKSALKEVKKLSGMLPICSHCKKIRDDKGYWNQIENYISEHSEAEFSHGICKECAEKYYPDLGLYED